MTAFPLFLDLAGRPCLIVGGGAAGCEKVRHLAAAGAQVLVIDPLVSSELASIAAESASVSFAARPFKSGDCRGRFLVFTCTDDASVNDAAARDAAFAGALCCRADGGAAGDFQTGALVRRGELCVAVSSGGASPSLSQLARDRIASVIGEEFAEAAAMLSGLRERLREVVPDARRRREAMRSAATGDLVAALRDGRLADAEAEIARAFESAAGESACIR